MSANVVNGVVLNDAISKELERLQDGYAKAIAVGLDDAIGFLLQHNEYFIENSNGVLNILATLHNARTELLSLIPEKEKGGQV